MMSAFNSFFNSCCVALFNFINFTRLSKKLRDVETPRLKPKLT